MAQNNGIAQASDVQRMKFDTLAFTGKWNEFFGNPENNFYCVIYSGFGQGKSTFAIQFANYLAKNFGATVYNSNEEGFSHTMKQKLDIVKEPISDNLLISDWKNFDELKKELRSRTSLKFVFVDSLDNAKISAENIKELRDMFPETSFITISQVTKDGKMRGSNELAHDSDIVVQVENGIAKTTKNRFKIIGQELKVF